MEGAIITFKNKSVNFFQEDFYLLIYFFILIVIFFIFLNTNNDFSMIFLALCSSISNIGVSKHNISPNLSFIFFILVIIGSYFF